LRPGKRVKERFARSRVMACPQAVAIRIAFDGDFLVCVKRLLTTATTRPLQSSTGAPDAP
jgi:hypothetical protein